MLIQEDTHLRHLYNYIHLNPLDLITPEWREDRLDNQQKALEFLENYCWSSYLDFIGKKNFPSVINKNFGIEIFGNEQTYYANLKEWLSDIQRSYSEINSLILE